MPATFAGLSVGLSHRSRGLDVRLGRRLEVGRLLDDRSAMQLDAKVRRSPALNLSWLMMSIVPQRCLLDAMRRSGLLLT